MRDIQIHDGAIHFIETAPSVLREIPYIAYKEYKVDNNEKNNLVFHSMNILCDL